jgi:hypothetical protein
LAWAGLEDFMVRTAVVGQYYDAQPPKELWAQELGLGCTAVPTRQEYKENKMDSGSIFLKKRGVKEMDADYHGVDC